MYNFNIFILTENHYNKITCYLSKFNVKMDFSIAIKTYYNK